MFFDFWRCMLIETGMKGSVDGGEEKRVEKVQIDGQMSDSKG